jgi:cyclohexanone monooxygenase
MILEAQLDHVLGAVKGLLDGWASLEVRASAQESFNAEVQQALGGTVYETGGCASYYHDVNGRNSFSWPWSTRRLRQQVGRFDASAYTIRTGAEVAR